VSDVGVGALCARSAVLGAGLNVRINAKSLEDQDVAGDYVRRASELEERARAAEGEILEIVEGRL
jgi:glutamate formiminotransferase/formiminotetrahydrofolate cyclodeaminase